MAFDPDRAIARIPKGIVILSLAGTGIAGVLGGTSWALSFLLGGAGAWINFILIERFVTRLGTLAPAQAGQSGARRSAGAFIRLLLFVLGAFVILRVSQLNAVAVLSGFLVCPAAVILEILYELLTYGHS